MMNFPAKKLCLQNTLESADMPSYYHQGHDGAHMISWKNGRYEKPRTEGRYAK